MREHITIKTLITAGVVMYALKCFWDTYIQYSTQISIDAGAGFAVGLLFSFFLFVQVKGVGFVYKVVCEEIAERRKGKARSLFYGEER